MTKYRKLSVRILCGIFAMSLLLGTYHYHALADTSDSEASIKQKQEEIDKAQKKK